MCLGRGRGVNCQIGGFGWVCGRDIPRRGPNSALRVSVGSLIVSIGIFFFLPKKKKKYSKSFEGNIEV